MPPHRPVVKFKAGCAVALPASLQVENFSLCERFAEKSTSVQIEGELKRFEGKEGKEEAVILIRLEGAEETVKVAKGYLRKIPLQRNFIGGFTKVPLSEHVTKEAFIKTINDFKSIVANDANDEKKAKAVSSHLSNLYTLVNMHQLKAAYFPDADARDNANKAHLSTALAKRIVAGDVVWKRVVDKELGRLGDGEKAMRSVTERRRRRPSASPVQTSETRRGQQGVEQALASTLAEQKKLQEQLDGHRQADEGGKKVTFTRNALLGQVQQANSLLRDKISKAAQAEGLDSTSLLEAMGLRNMSSAKERASLVQELSCRRRSHEVKEEVLRKIKLGLEYVNLTELTSPKEKRLFGETEKVAAKDKVTKESFLDELNILLTYTLFTTHNMQTMCGSITGQGGGGTASTSSNHTDSNYSGFNNNKGRKHTSTLKINGDTAVCGGGGTSDSLSVVPPHTRTSPFSRAFATGAQSSMESKDCRTSFANPFCQDAVRDLAEGTNRSLAPLHRSTHCLPSVGGVANISLSRRRGNLPPIAKVEGEEVMGSWLISSPHSVDAGDKGGPMGGDDGVRPSWVLTESLRALLEQLKTCRVVALVGFEGKPRGLYTCDPWSKEELGEVVSEAQVPSSPMWEGYAAFRAALEFGQTLKYSKVSAGRRPGLTNVKIYVAVTFLRFAGRSSPAQILHFLKFTSSKQCPVSNCKSGSCPARRGVLFICICLSALRSSLVRSRHPGLYRPLSPPPPDMTSYSLRHPHTLLHTV
eukprot:g77116.t1